MTQRVDPSMPPSEEKTRAADDRFLCRLKEANDNLKVVIFPGLFHQVNLNEEVIKELRLAANRMQLKVSPYKIISLKLMLKE